MPGWLETITDVITAVGIILGAITGLAGVAWKVLKPRALEFLRRELIHPVQETHHQVTVNHHSSAEPTVLDRIDDVAKQVQTVRGEVVNVRDDVAAVRDDNARQDRRLNRIETKTTALTTVVGELVEHVGPQADETPDLD